MANSRSKPMFFIVFDLRLIGVLIGLVIGVILAILGSLFYFL